MANTIATYAFSKDGLSELEESQNGLNWPVVYFIHDDKSMYIGETTSAAIRMSQHLNNPEKSKLKTIEIVFNNEFNKSVILDYEQRLIKYCSVDNKYNVINKNKGQQASHDYYERSDYRSKFSELWDSLKEIGIVSNSISVIENKNIFKFSPYNSLTGEQNAIVIKLIGNIIESFSNNSFNKNGKACVSMVEGCAGTGKTVLAISAINSLVNAANIDDRIFDSNNDEYDVFDEEKLYALKRIKDFINNERNGEPLKIGFVFPMGGIRKTIKEVFSYSGNGLTASMVIGPNDVIKDKYDILFVDESHRLSRRKNLTGYGAYDDVCKKLGLDKEETNQLEWVLKSAHHVVLFYDQYQSVKSSDIPYNEFIHTINSNSNVIFHHRLQTQMRCEGGDSYIKYVKAIVDGNAQEFKKIENYDLLLYDDVNQMVEDIRVKDNELGLSKTVAGYSWEWITKSKKSQRDNMDYYNQLIAEGKHDISIDGHNYIWNISDNNWINRQDSHYTIGCIHTCQGYDMNYVGVIFGREIDYDSVSGKIIIDIDKYKDKKVKAATDKETLENLIRNTYITILARGIKGCYVYACNPNMQNYLRKYIATRNGSQ